MIQNDSTVSKINVALVGKLFEALWPDWWWMYKIKEWCICPTILSEEPRALCLVSFLLFCTFSLYDTVWRWQRRPELPEGERSPGPVAVAVVVRWVTCVGMTGCCSCWLYLLASVPTILPGTDGELVQQLNAGPSSVLLIFSAMRRFRSDSHFPCFYKLCKYEHSICIRRCWACCCKFGPLIGSTIQAFFIIYFIIIICLSPLGLLSICIFFQAGKWWYVLYEYTSFENLQGSYWSDQRWYVQWFNRKWCHAVLNVTWYCYWLVKYKPVLLLLKKKKIFHQLTGFHATICLVYLFAAIYFILGKCVH